MHAWLCDNPIGVQALRWTELPTPLPAPGQVRIAVHAASLNFPDLLTVQNKYQIKPPLPFVPGSEFSGTVEAVGEGARHRRVGGVGAVPERNRGAQRRNLQHHRATCRIPHAASLPSTTICTRSRPLYSSRLSR